MNPTIFNLLESWLPTSSNTLATFLFENSCYSFLKTLFSDRHYRIHNWSRKAHGHLWTEDVAEIFCAGPLLGIFAYILRQRTIIHWWRLGSGAPAAWHHCCWRSQSSTGIIWIPIECSSERNIFDDSPDNFLSKESISKIFSTRRKLSVENCPLLQATVNAKLGPRLSLNYSLSILLVFRVFLLLLEYFLVI